MYKADETEITRGSAASNTSDFPLRAAFFCHNGLGDGVNSLVLSQNLSLHGWKVDTYHNTMGSMQNWFPHLSIRPYPEIDEIPEILSSYDYWFVVEDRASPFVQALIKEGKSRFPDRIKVLYLYPSWGIKTEPYYSDCLIHPFIPFAENMRRFCRQILEISSADTRNGLVPPTDLVFRKHPKRIVVHPTSAKEERNWPKESHVKLALHLKKAGYEMVFVPGTQGGWTDIPFEVATFPTLDLLACYIFESGYLIGNDSGLGHLASALGIPTLTIFRRKAAALFWRPSFSRNVVVHPNQWIPNFSGLRWRDRYWKRWVTVNRALKGFNQLIIEELENRA